MRYRFRGRGTSDFVLFLNIAAPEIVLGASLLSLFITFGVPRGTVTIIISHVMFNIAYVAITVRARLTGFEREIEEAAQDLGAGPWTTFRTVTLPLIFPGVLAGALLGFALSLDDFIITNFNAGATQTFPLWVYGGEGWVSSSGVRDGHSHLCCGRAPRGRQRALATALSESLSTGQIDRR